jgi:hypothetical protein
MRCLGLLGLVAGLNLPPYGALGADVSYKHQSLGKRGDVVDSFLVNDRRPFRIGDINDKGHVSFPAESAKSQDLLLLHAEGQLILVAKPGDQVGAEKIDGVGSRQWLTNNRDLLFHAGARDRTRIFRWTDGKLTPFIIEGGNALGVSWPNADDVDIRLRVNPRGDAVFAYEWSSQVFLDGFPPITIQTEQDNFLWDHQVPGSRTDLTPSNAFAYQDAQGTWQFRNLGLLHWSSHMGLNVHSLSGGPVINNSGEMAFIAWVVNAVTQVAKPVILFRDCNGQHHPIVELGQVLADGHTVEEFGEPRLNEAGTVVFRVRRQGDLADKLSSDSLYQWEKGQSTPTPLLALDPDLPERQPFYAVTDHWVNSKNRNVLLRIAKSDGSGGLYLMREGETVPQKVAVTGEPIVPGGPTFKGIAWFTDGNGAGQHLLLASVEQPNSSDAIAAYQVDGDGQLTLLLQNGTTTEWGKVLQIGVEGAGPNNHGQVALGVQIEEPTGTRPHVVLLTPAAP